MTSTLTRFIPAALLGVLLAGCATVPGDPYYDPYYQQPGYIYNAPQPVYPAYSAPPPVIYYGGRDRDDRWERDRGRNNNDWRERERERERAERERARDRAENQRQAREREQQRREQMRDSDRREQEQLPPERWRRNNDPRNRQTPLSDR